MRVPLSLLLALCGADAAVRAAAPDRPPNIVFIVTDDQGPWALGASGAGQALTPQLDRLARDGVVFRQAFGASAICSAARAALITGRYPSEAGLLDFIADNGRNGMRPALPTWPAMLRESGYTTALVGKWHLGHARPEFLPTARGYDFFSGYPIGGKTSQSPSIEVEGTWKTFAGEFTTDVLTDLAIGYIRRFRDRPFAVSLHYWAPHANQGVPPGFTLPYDDRTWLPMKEEDLAVSRNRPILAPVPEAASLDQPRYERIMREYLASVHGVDRNVGRLLDVLDELGLARDTLVVFTSDNGYLLGQHSLWHKGSGWWLTTDRKDPARVHGATRFNLFEESIRVPMLARWPARIRPGTVVSDPVSHLDWFPTLLEAAGKGSVAVPDLRGRSLLPTIDGRPLGGDDAMFFQYVHLRGLRTRQWKLVRDLKSERDELYDLLNDPAEVTNLLPARDEAAAAAHRDLLARLDARMRAIGDRGHAGGPAASERE
jgi:choline-sulfatase